MFSPLLRHGTPAQGIHRLPDEILTIIFSILVEAKDDRHSSTWLSHVCSRWRNILLHMSGFWVTALWYLLDDELGSCQWNSRRDNIVRMCVSRTGSRPLSIAFGYTLPPAMWELLSPHFGRVARLQLYLPVAQLRQAHQVIGSSMGGLKWLSLRSWDWDDGREEVVEAAGLAPWDDSALPALGTIILAPAAFISACVVKSLTDITLVGGVPRQAFASFVEAFRRCPMLEELSMRHYHLVGAGTPTASTPIVLPHLRILNVEDSTGSLHLIRLFLDRFDISHPICFVLDGGDFDGDMSQWRTSLPGLYPTSRIDTVSLRVRLHVGKDITDDGWIQLEGRCASTLCFRERHIEAPAKRLVNIKHFLTGLPRHVHTLCLDVVLLPEGKGEMPSLHESISRSMIDALRGLRTLKLAASTAKRDALEAFFEHAARSTADGSMAEGSRFELVWVVDEEPAPRVWDEDEWSEDVEPRSAAEIEKDLALLLDIVASCPPRKTWSLMLQLQVRPETKLFDAVWQRWTRDPKGRGWEDAAMEITTVRALAPVVNDMVLVFGDTKLQLGKLTIS